jgi:hypothetical protein
MSVYHFELAEECETDYWDKKYFYSYIEANYSEVVYGVQSVSVKIVGGIISIRNGRFVSNKQFWLVIGEREVMIKDIISKVYFRPVFLKSKMAANIDQGQRYLGYCSPTSS